MGRVVASKFFSSTLRKDGPTSSTKEELGGRNVCQNMPGGGPGPVREEMIMCFASLFAIGNL